MKLRIHRNSVRFRLGRSEVQRLLEPAASRNTSRSAPSRPTGSGTRWSSRRRSPRSCAAFDCTNLRAPFRPASSASGPVPMTSASKPPRTSAAASPANNCESSSKRTSPASTTRKGTPTHSQTRHRRRADACVALAPVCCAYGHACVTLARSTPRCRGEACLALPRGAPRPNRAAFPVRLSHAPSKARIRSLRGMWFPLGRSVRSAAVDPCHRR